MKNLLFIGDLRTAHNYGAVATTESLLRLIDDECLNINIRCIDFRSLYHPTPTNGFPKLVTKETKKNSDLRNLIKLFVPQYIFRLIRKTEKVDSIDFVPYKFCQYENYYLNLIQGKNLQYEKNLLEWADVIYINGEGNIVHGTDAKGKYRMGARYILFMAWLAKFKYHKPTLLVNHTVDPDNDNAFEMIENIYPALDVVYVREKMSLALLEKRGIKNVKFVPDALFSFKPTANWQPSEFLKSQVDFSKPYICIGDSSGLKNKYSRVKWNVYEVYVEIINKLKKIVPQIVFVDGTGGGNEEKQKIIRDTNITSLNINNTSYQDLYHVLKRSSIFISGRWHASILCLLGNTPILLWGSDSHKTRSLYPMMNYQQRFFEVSTIPVNIDEIIEEVVKILNNTEKLKKEIKEKVDEYSKMSEQNSKILREYV